MLYEGNTEHYNSNDKTFYINYLFLTEAPVSMFKGN